jgi:hypothetical protein
MKYKVVALLKPRLAVTEHKPSGGSQKPPTDSDLLIPKYHIHSPEGKVRQNWTTFSSPGFGIANFSFLAGKTSYLLITKLGLLTIKMLVLPRLSNFVQFHWTPYISFFCFRFPSGCLYQSGRFKSLIHAACLLLLMLSPLRLSQRWREFHPTSTKSKRPTLFLLAQTP